MSKFGQLAVLGLVVCLVVPSLADDAAKKGKKGGKKGQKGNAAAIAQAFNLPKGIELSEEQQEQLAALKKEFTPQLKELATAVNLTKEQRQAMAAARKAAMAEGKKGKEARAAVAAAANLTPEQKQAQAKMLELRKEIRGKIMGMLTADQKAKLRGGAGKKGKKKADAA